MNLYLNYILFLGLVIFIFCQTGKFIFYLLKLEINERYSALFAYCLSGALLFSLLASTFWTKGITVQLGLLIPVLYFIWKDSSARALRSRPPFRFYLGKEIWITAAMCILFFMIYASAVFNGLDLPRTPKIDNLIYARISSFLAETGKENPTLNYVFATDTGTIPYHYLELWINAGISKVLNTNPVLTLSILVNPFFVFLAWLGAMALVSVNHWSFRGKALTCMVLLFSSGPFYTWHTYFPFTRDIDVFSLSVFINGKGSVVFVFLLASLLLFMNKRTTEGILVLLSVPVISFSTIIGVIPAVLLFTTFLFLHNRRNQKPTKELFASGVIAFSIVSFIALFYKLTMSSLVSHVPTDTGSLLGDMMTTSFFQRAINIVGASTMQIQILYAPVLLLLFYFKRGWMNLSWIRNHPYSLLAPGMIIISLFGWAVTHPLPGTAIQVFNSIAVPVFNLCTMLLFLFALTQKEKATRVWAYLVIAVTVTPVMIDYYRENSKAPQYSKSFLHSVEKVSKDLSRNGVLMLDSAYYPNHYFSMYSFYSPVGSYLSMMGNPCLTNITIDFYHLSEDSHKRNMELHGLMGSPFLQYVEQKRKDGAFVNMQACRYDFINAFDVNYVIASKDYPNDSVLEFHTDFVLQDSLSGERLIKLKNLPLRY